MTQVTELHRKTKFYTKHLFHCAYCSLGKLKKTLQMGLSKIQITEESLDQLDNQSRRNDLRISGLAEDWQQTEAIVKQSLKDSSLPLNKRVHSVFILLQLNRHRESSQNQKHINDKTIHRGMWQLNFLLIKREDMSSKQQKLSDLIVFTLMKTFPSKQLKEESFILR